MNVAESPLYCPSPETCLAYVGPAVGLRNDMVYITNSKNEVTNSQPYLQKYRLKGNAMMLIHVFPMWEKLVLALGERDLSMYACQNAVQARTLYRMWTAM